MKKVSTEESGFIFSWLIMSKKIPVKAIPLFSYYIQIKHQFYNNTFVFFCKDDWTNWLLFESGWNLLSLKISQPLHKQSLAPSVMVIRHNCDIIRKLVVMATQDKSYILHCLPLSCSYMDPKVNQTFVEKNKHVAYVANLCFKNAMSGFVGILMK